MKIRVTLVAMLILHTLATGVCTDIPRSCLDCICEVEGCEAVVGQCNPPFCGPYQITRPYWIDCGSPGADYETCTKQKECSETCIDAYMLRYAVDCAGGRRLTCSDYAKIHNAGPQGCTQPLEHYWGLVRDCCGGETACDPTN